MKEITERHRVKGWTARKGQQSYFWSCQVHNTVC